MKRILILVPAILGLCALLLSGCNVIIGTGSIVSRQYDFKNFDKIEAGNAMVVQVNRADSHSVTVAARENIFDHLDISEAGKTLFIHLAKGSYSNTEIKVTITMPDLYGFKLSGASNGDVQGFKSSNNFDLSVSGASRLNINMETGRTEMDISGASRVSGQLKALDTTLTLSGASRCELSGSANETTFNVSGASQALTGEFQIQNADMSVSGASKAIINTNGTLNVDVTGASTLEYFGNPTMKKMNVTGSSRLSHQ